MVLNWKELVDVDDGSRLMVAACVLVVDGP